MRTLLILSLLWTDMTLLAFIINGKAPREKERWKSSVNLDKTLINNLRILARILFGAIAFEGLRDNIFLASISSVGLRKKEFTLLRGRKKS